MSGEVGQSRYGSSSLARIFGGSPFGVIIRLALLCVIVGLVMDQLDLNAYELFRRGLRALDDIIANSADLIRALVRYFLIGAVVVIPIWIVMRVLRIGSRR